MKGIPTIIQIILVVYHFINDIYLPKNLVYYGIFQSTIYLSCSLTLLIWKHRFKIFYKDVFVSNENSLQTHLCIVFCC